MSLGRCVRDLGLGFLGSQRATISFLHFLSGPERQRWREKKNMVVLKSNLPVCLLRAGIKGIRHHCPASASLLDFIFLALIHVFTSNLLCRADHI